MPTYSSLKPTLTLTSRLGQNVGLGEGQVGQLSRNLNWSDVLSFLLICCHQGADPYVEDESGKTVFDIAKEKDLTKIKALLDNHKKK